MFAIKKYLNFNNTQKTEIRTFVIDEDLTAGICKYKGNERSIFLVEEPTLTYVVVGVKYMIVNNTEFFINAGDVLYIPQNSIVFTYIPEQENGFESTNIKLPKTLLNKEPDSLSSAVLRSQDVKFQKIITKFRNLLMVESLSVKEKKAGCIHCVIQLISQFNFTLSQKISLKEIPTKDLEKIKTVLLETIFKPTLISDIAEQCNMSTSTFKRKFESEFGLPPKTWKRTICLQTAFFNLKTGHYKVSDIIDNIGFENFSHFSYAFKKQFNFSPSYIAEHKLT